MYCSVTLQLHRNASVNLNKSRNHNTLGMHMLTLDFGLGLKI